MSENPYGKSLLTAKFYRISEGIDIRLPSIQEILDFGDIEYFGALYALSSTPYERMGDLAIAGIDYEKITESQLLFYSFKSMSDDIAAMLFKDLKPSEFHRALDASNNEILYNRTTQTTMTDITMDKIANFFRLLRGVEKDMHKAANKAAKKYLIEKEVKRINRSTRSARKPYLDALIIKMVNAPEFGFSFNECLNCNIYVFNTSVKQVMKRIEYDQIMGGVCQGTIDVTKLNMEKIHWLSDK